MSFNRQMKRDFGPRKNQYIKLPVVSVVDQDGNNLGEMKTEEALNMAREAGLDLVEVAANVRPPVCKIMDYSKHLYEQKKKQRKNRQKTKNMKEFKFSPVIGVHDREMRVRRAKQFLSKGYPVRVTVFKKRRQTKEQAKEMFDLILTNFADYSSIEPEKKVEGNTIFITFKPNGKAKNKQNGGKENEADKSEGTKETKGDVQQNSSAPSKD